MFCLGLDPKLDISQLATSVNSTTTLNHSHSHTTPVSHPHSTPMSHSNTTPACSTPTAMQTTSIASGISQDRVELSITGQKSFSTSLSLVASPATPRRTPSPNKHSSNRYQSVPSLPMVVSGCHAVLQFLGVGMGQVTQSLIEQGEIRLHNSLSKITGLYNYFPAYHVYRACWRCDVPKACCSSGGGSVFHHLLGQTTLVLGPLW